MRSVPKTILIDANILFSFFKSKSARRYVFEELLNLNCKIVSPEFVLEELKKDKEKIMKFSSIDSDEFEFLFSIMKSHIEIIKNVKYKGYFESSEKISPHKKDVPYFALALEMECPIWSDEKEFKSQGEVEVISTKDFLKILKIE